MRLSPAFRSQLERELIAEGMDALQDACAKYRPSRRIPFSTYASVIIERRMWKCVEQELSYLAFPSMPQDSFDLDLLVPLPDIMFDSSEKCSHRRTQHVLRGEKDAPLLMLRFGLVDGVQWTCEEIATLYEMEPQTIRIRIRRALRRLSAKRTYMDPPLV
jgi:DNA-directed RNA polymerase sigma subunit (sigma70/sigma32)